MPPDRIPRVAYKLGDPGFTRAYWAALRLCGPGGLAVRPARWRRSGLRAHYKDGDPSLQENYRLLEIKNQLGLAQEGLLFRRCKARVWGTLQEEQSGYRRSTDDPLSS